MQIGIGEMDWTDKRMLVQLLVLFEALFLVSVIVQVPRCLALFLQLVLIAANYYSAGISKLIVSPNGHEWLTQNELHNLVTSAWLYGWLHQLSGDTLSGMIAWIQPLDRLFAALTLVVELGWLFAILKRRLFLAIGSQGSCCILASGR